jgi:hypothetical protein
MLYTNTFRQSTGQGGMNDLRRKQRQSQHPCHIRLILADAPRKFVNVGETPFVDQME